eukprot:Skav203137  [mRNA]  locus=scaffold2505:1352:2185:- [translate_table: standard]
MGPIPLRGNAGTLTSEDRSRIWHATGVSASVRWRQQWGARCLTLNGPAEKLTEAKRMADEAIRANGTEGGRAPDPQETLQRVNQVASSQNSMWTSMQAMSGRIAVLEAQVMEAQNAAAAASAAAYEAAVQAQALQQQLQAKKKRKKRAPKSSSGESTDGQKRKPEAAQGESPQSAVVKGKEEAAEEHEKAAIKPESSGSTKADEVVKEEPLPQAPQEPLSPTSDADKTVMPSESEDTRSGQEAPTVIPVEEVPREMPEVPDQLPLEKIKEEKSVDDD